MISVLGPRAKDVGPSVRLDRVIEKPELLFRNSIFEIRSFTLMMYVIVGSKRGQGKSSFVGSVLKLSNRFYEAVVRNLKAWFPPSAQSQA
jgi:hypothetical protein